MGLRWEDLAGSVRSLAPTVPLTLALALCAGFLSSLAFHFRLRARGTAMHVGASLRMAWTRPWVELRCLVSAAPEASLAGAPRGWGGSAPALPWIIASEGLEWIVLAACGWAGGLAPGSGAAACGCVFVARVAGLAAPIFGGWGVREALLCGVLGSAGIPAGRVVAAGLPILGAALVRLISGGWMFAAEQRRRRGLHRGSVARISVVMPVLNEADGLEETVGRALRVPEVSEVIVVDGGSRDATRERARRLGARLLESPAGRGGQMRAGGLVATGDVVLFLHADTWLEPGAGKAVLRCLEDPTVVAGGFWKRFRQTPLLLLGSRPKCLVRLLVGRRIVGDMAMFVRREELVAIGGVPSMELMEDFELSRRLRARGRLALAESTVSTSARRFREHGVVATYLRMWRVATLYRLGRSPSDLRRIYG